MEINRNMLAYAREICGNLWKYNGNLLKFIEINRN